MEYEYDDAEIKKQRIRTIAFTTAIAVIVLGIAIWAIIAIVGSRNNTEIADTTEMVATVDATSKEKTVEEQPAPVTEGVVKATEPAKKSNTVAAPAKEAVPETGPEELLPLALVAGAAAAYVSSKKLAVREA
ncbi:hypothetical protein IJG91_01480 [Candidatus Saccharibacteria bacterium]|nr:hypothetical protein [Candidatus Saccharibacteria bacterium]